MKRIAVFGSRRAMDELMRIVQDPGQFILIHNIHSIDGYMLSDIILTRGWENSYINPHNLLIQVKRYGTR